MRKLVASAIIVSMLASAHAQESLPDPFVNMTFFKLLLYNYTAAAWNQRTRDAYQRNATYTADKGICSNTTNNPYKGPAGGTEDLDLRGVNTTKQVFTAGCGLIYASEPVYYENSHNRTWVQGDTLSLSVGAGCTTREVNGTWDNYCPATPGGGHHKEYLVPVEETTTVTVNGGLCYNDTVIHGQGRYPERVDSVRMLQINCTVNGTHAEVRLEHTCVGHTLLDSAYSIMGFKVDCDDGNIEALLMQRCTDGCALANGKNCLAHCTNVVEDMKPFCKPRKSQPVNCPTPPRSTFGSPDDGTSSPPQIQMPKLTDYCAVYCDEHWDQSNTCMNNRISVISDQGYACKDEREYVIDLKPNISCNGSYYPWGNNIRGHVELEVSPDTATAFVVGGIPYGFLEFYPRHALYRMEDGSGPVFKEYRLTEWDYRFNESHNDTSYYDFTYPETVPNRSPPTIGENLVIEGFSGGNGSWRLDYTLSGRQFPENLTLTVLGVEERINRENRTPCDYTTPCPKGHACLEKHCIDPAEFGKMTVPLSECFREAAATDLTLDAPQSVGEYGNFTMTATLKANGTTLTNRTIGLECSSGLKANATTDANGAATFNVTAGRNNVRCTGAFGGDDAYAPSAQTREIGVELAAYDPQPWVMFLGLLTVFAVIFTVAEGRHTLYDIFETGRGFFR